LIRGKWKKYREFQKKEEIEVQGYDVVIYPWLLPPTSNFWINYLLIPFNWIWYKGVVEKKVAKRNIESDLVLAQNLIPDAILTYWLHKKYNIPYILNIRGATKELWFKLPLLRNIIKDASKLITPSPTYYKLLQKSYDIQLIPHPVDDIFYYDEHKDYEYPK